MDFDTGILSLIEGYVSEALSTTGTKRALAVPAAEQFEGDTIPDAKAMYARPPTSESWDELTTAVNIHQRLSSG